MASDDFFETYKRAEIARKLTQKTNHERRMEGLLEGFYAQALQMAARKESPEEIQPVLDLIDRIEKKLSPSDDTSET